MPEKTPTIKDLLKTLPKTRPLFFKRPDSEVLFGIPSRVLSDLAMAKKGPPFYKRGKYAIYDVSDFIKWLTRHPIKTVDDD